MKTYFEQLAAEKAKAFEAKRTYEALNELAPPAQSKLLLTEQGELIDLYQHPDTEKKGLTMVIYWE